MVSDLVEMVTLKISQKKIGIYGTVCGLFTAVGGVIGWIIMPILVVKIIDLVIKMPSYVVNHKTIFSLIFQNVVLYNNSDQFQRWQKFPQPLEFKVFVFNVTNPDEIHRGALPIVKEVGPYIYK